MIPSRPSHVVEQLTSMDFKPSRILGQNFLVDQNIRNIILKAAAVTPNDIVLEVGAGLGVLTQPLSERANEVIAVEKDQRLFIFLQTHLAGTMNLELIHADITEVDLDGLLSRDVNKVVANLPYVIASRFLVDAVLSPHRPERIVVTVQREVAQRLTAQPRRKTYGTLTILGQLFYDVELLKIVRPTCFYPPPQVDSALVRLKRRDYPLVDVEDAAIFAGFTKFLFSQRRKQLGTILRNAPSSYRIPSDDFEFALRPFDITPHMRPEALSPQQVAVLANTLAHQARSGGNGRPPH